MEGWLTSNELSSYFDQKRSEIYLNQSVVEVVERDRGIQQQQVSDYYKKAVSNIDTDGDGALSAEELFYAVHHPEMEIRDIAARMVVKHDSEWFGGSSHHKWEVYFQNYDLLRMKYAKQGRDDVEWMSKVEPFSSGQAVWHMHPVVFLSSLKTEGDCAKLIWGEVVNQRLGVEKACQFRKKVVEICADLWGEEKKIEFANALMACMAVETSRLFSASVIKLMPKHNSQGMVLLNSKGKPIRDYRPLTKQELNADPSLAAQNAVGLIQFTGPAVTQINRVHGLSVTKQKLALMDEIEQLDYVKLYFTSNKKLFNKIKNGDDIYLYIFCPAGVGKSDDFALYSRQKDRDEKVNYYQASYHIVYGPVLTSRHTQRRAIDMTITGIMNKTMKNAAGVDVLVKSQSVLHEVGASYGVHKLLSDPPHWSDDGH